MKHLLCTYEHILRFGKSLRADLRIGSTCFSSIFLGSGMPQGPQLLALARLLLLPLLMIIKIKVLIIVKKSIYRFKFIDY